MDIQFQHFIFTNFTCNCLSVPNVHPSHVSAEIWMRSVHVPGIHHHNKNIISQFTFTRNNFSKFTINQRPLCHSVKKNIHHNQIVAIHYHFTPTSHNSQAPQTTITQFTFTTTYVTTHNQPQCYTIH